MNDNLAMSRRLVCESGKAFPVPPRRIADSPETITFTGAMIQRTDELLQKFANLETQHVAPS
jgi:hypothetical protein